jgi:hypothetical protein
MKYKRTIIASLLVLLSTGLFFADRGEAFQSCIPQTEAEQNQNQNQSMRIAPCPTLVNLKRDFKNSFPFRAGEKLEYEVKYSRFPIYASVGIVTFEYLGIETGAESAPIEGLNVEFKPSAGDQFVRLRASAVSKGFLIALLGIDVKDRFETLVDSRDFAARLSFKEIKEGKKHVTQSGLFDRERKTVNYAASDLNKPDQKIPDKELERSDGMLDLLSAFYFVRLQKFKEGQLMRFPVSDDGVNYTFNIIIGKQERLDTECGKIKTVRIEPKLFGPGQLFSRQGEMSMWLTDDNKRIPVRLVAKTSAGTVTAKLLNFKENCKILDPVLEDNKNTKQKGD